MSASISNTSNPTIAASSTAAAANKSSSGSSANVAAGSAQPTARSSYANATQKNSSPTIASSGAPPLAVGGPQSAQHGKSSSVSPVNGSTSIKPAIPSMPAIVGGNPNGNGDHSRKSSVHIKQSAPPTGPPSTLKFGSLASPAPAHASPAVQGNLSIQPQNPRIASPAHSPSPIPPPISGGPKPDSLPTRPNLVFGGQGGEGTDASTRPMNMPSQHNSLPQAQHLRRESSQSAHSDMSNANMNRGYPQNGGRGRGGFAPQHTYPNQPSPQPYRAHPNMGRGMPPTFTPQNMPQNSPYRQNRSPAIPPAGLHQQAQYANPQAMPYGYPAQPYPQQPNMYAHTTHPYDPQGIYAMGYGGLQQSIHYPGPQSPAFRTQQMQAPYGYGVQPQAQGMSRTPSNMSERPSSAVPTTPAMTNVNHISHAHTPSVTAASPAPSSTFERPKKQSKAIVIKTADGEVVDFKKPKGASPAPAAALAPPAQPPRSPAIAASPTPPPRAPSATDSVRNEEKTAEEKKSEFVRQFQEKMRLQEESKNASLKAESDANQKAEEESKAKIEQEAKEKDEAAAADKAKTDAAEKKRLEDEELERMIAEMELEEAKREAEEKKYEEERKARAEQAKLKAAEAARLEDEKLKELERQAEAAELARENQTPEQKAQLEAQNKAMFASLAKNTILGPQASASEEAPVPVEAPTPPPAAKPTSAKSKPSALKLDTQKPIEPAQPTAGMQSLKSARFLQVRQEIAYPVGISSPNPALNAGTGRNKGRQYDKDFLLQFQDVFKEKPSTDWDLKLKESVGDGTDSARPQSARGGPMSSRQPSSRGMGPGNAMGAMGNFTGPGGRTIPAGTTSQQRFEAASGGGRSMTNPLAHVVMGSGRGQQFPMGAPGMVRNQSYSNMQGPGSPRNASQRGKGGSRRGGPPNKNEHQEAKAMPLTAGQAVKDLDRSQTGWKPQSITGNPAQQQTSGHMAPDMVQRKVKAALNKMTPEKFDKISDQILEIAAQSKDETDGRTLRQVIQLTFEKACDESHWSSMYAKFCARMLATMSTEIKDENVRDKHGNPVVGGSLFRKYLLNRCQEEFERGWEINLPAAPEEGVKTDFSEDYYIAAAAKRKGLGLIQFIGELYKLGMLTLRIMHECVLKLLDFEGLPDESAIESLVKLLRTVGSTMESAEAGPKMIGMYFERISKVMNMEGLPSRLRFMLLDTIDMRRNGWKSKDILKGPKTIAEIHQEALAAQQAAEMERTRSNQRGGGGGRLPMGRGDARSFSGGGMMPPPDTGSRVQMDDLRKLSKGASGRNMNTGAALGPSMLGSRSGSGRRGLGPSMMGGRDDSGNSSRTGTPPVQKEKESTAHANAFSALAALENAEDTGDVSSPPPTAEAKPSE